MNTSINNLSKLSTEKLLSYEWLETNGLGSYASSTILHSHTRKYHGLLVTTLPEYNSKFVLLSKIEDSLLYKNKNYVLSSHQYKDCFIQGRLAKSFDLKPHPCSLYQCGDAKITKEILMPYKEDTVLIKYHLESTEPAKLYLNPLLAYRDFHKLMKKNRAVHFDMHRHLSNYYLSPYDGMPNIYINANCEVDFICEQNWFDNFVYLKEQERGFACEEDLFTAGKFILTLYPGKNFIISFSTKSAAAPLDLKWGLELERRKNFNDNLTGTDFQKKLKTTAYSFLQTHPATESLAITAGYHWFFEWGRDSMISLPGLTLYSGLEEECIAVLKTFAKHQKRGLIPNFLGCLPEQNSYDSVDASLWFAWALQQYYYKTKNLDIIKNEFWQTLLDIYQHYTEGTLFSIKMRENGLIYAGDSNIKLTWMDAVVEGVPSTARYGMAVEINALWYNFICFMYELTIEINDPLQSSLKCLSEKIKKSFIEVFWDKKSGCLKDYVNDDEESLSIRPNQIFSVSLPYSALSNSIAKKIVNIVHSHLLTPFGLRTLSPTDPKYIAYYEGGPLQRDAAYHNGTVWPWLLCHFAEALLKVEPDKLKCKKILTPCLTALEEHLSCSGLGGISEIFDGNAPQMPHGCINQAWSICEILRLTYLI